MSDPRWRFWTPNEVRLDPFTVADYRRCALSYLIIGIVVASLLWWWLS